MIPIELLDAFKKNKAGIYIGAGVSVGAGLPSWEGLLRAMIEFTESVSVLSSSKERDLKELATDSDKFLLLAEEIKEILGPDFFKFISLTFKEHAPPPGDLHKEIVKIPAKFTITTNYDNLLERAYAVVFSDIPNTYTFRDSSDIIYNLFNDRFFILKAHGDASKAHQGIILTEQDYRGILYKEPGYKSIVENLFASNSILFIGSSLSDPELKLFLSYIHNAFHGSGPTHYALMAEDNMNEVEMERWRKDYNIKILPYNPQNNHEFLLSFVRELIEKLKKTE